MRIAIMQPYFIPYAGYFRLFHAVDLFVLFDCVQFPRRGFLHRNRLYNAKNELQWLTLPLLKAPQSVKIMELLFADESDLLWAKQLRTFPSLATEKAEENRLLRYIRCLSQTPVEFIIATLKIACEELQLPFNVARSSELNLPADLMAEDRIIEIAKRFDAKEYINLAGGRELYQPDHFSARGLKLKFLSDYQGNYESILQRLLIEDRASLRADIIKQTNLDD